MVGAHDCPLEVLRSNPQPQQAQTRVGVVYEALAGCELHQGCTGWLRVIQSLHM
jgi:hypothetical protein